MLRWRAFGILAGIIALFAVSSYLWGTPWATVEEYYIIVGVLVGAALVLPLHWAMSS